MPPRRLSARWLIPIESRPIENGAVLIGPDGRILAVGPDAEVPRPPGVPAEAFGDAVLLPGLVNTHTHLELTGLSWKDSSDFTAWIRGVRELKATRTPEQFLEAARQGLADCHAAGVTTVADTGDSGAAIQALAGARASGIAYQEVFGPHPAQAAESLAGLQARVETLGRFAVERVIIGVSPHAPYTVSGPLYSATSSWARAQRIPMAVHLAESVAETDLLCHGTGGFAEAWRARGIPPPSPLGRTPVQWLEDHGVLSDSTLCIHAVQVGPEDRLRLMRAGSAIAHCPLSNRAHGHGAAPLAEFLACGLRVGIGTDSVLSVGELDLLADARAARALARLDAAATLAICTLEGARALGLAGELGSLRPGKWGDCVAIRVPAEHLTGPGPEDGVLATGPEDVLATYLGGRTVYRAGGPA